MAWAMASFIILTLLGPVIGAFLEHYTTRNPNA